jgi:hypothetical protein
MLMQLQLSSPASIRESECEGRGARHLARPFHLGSLPLPLLAQRSAGNDK